MSGKVTRLGPSRPLLSIGGAISGGIGGSGGGGGPGQVPTSNGSNGIYFGPNVATISVNGVLVTGPFVNFADGSNTTVSFSSNTIHVHSTGGGGGSGIDRPLMAYDPGTENYLVVVDGDGTAVMVEDT